MWTKNSDKHASRLEEMKGHDIRRVAIAGAGGNLGRVVATYLLERGFEVIILTRKKDADQRFKTLIGCGAEIVPLSESDRGDHLAEKTKGVDAIISTVSGDRKVFFDYQMDLLHAAKVNNVKLFIPSEFGVDTDQFEETDAAFFKDKVLFAKELDKSGVPYTRIMTGMFYDYAFAESFGFDWRNGKATILNDGNVPLRRSALIDVAKAVSLVLTCPKREKIVRIASEVMTDREVVCVFETVMERKFELQKKTSKELLEFGNQQSDPTIKVLSWLHANQEDLVSMPVNMQVPNSLTVKQYAILLRNEIHTQKQK